MVFQKWIGPLSKKMFPKDSDRGGEKTSRNDASGSLLSDFFWLWAVALVGNTVVHEVEIVTNAIKLSPVCKGRL